MDSGDIILTVSSTLVGGFIGGLTSLFFHRLATREGGKSTDQLLTSDEKTRRMVNAIGHVLSAAGFEVHFGADGKLVSVFKAQATLSGGGDFSARGIVTPPPPPPLYDRQHENPSAGPDGG